MKALRLALAAAVLVFAAPVWSTGTHTRASAQEGELDKRMKYYDIGLEPFCTGPCKTGPLCCQYPAL
ncbi:MAG TPA: hypothetical protein VM890_14040 [Longimicrobium sp.]|jgi:hypothetical protein|nr:hypothetical protein [Longimicrobium sp.]